MSGAPPAAIECPLRAAASERPDATALITPEERLSFRELDRMVSASADLMKRRNLAGRRVGFQLENGQSYVLLLFAAIRAGVVACPISTRLPASAVAERLDLIGASYLVMDEREGAATLSPASLLSRETMAPSGSEDSFPGHLAPSPGSADPLPVDQPATIVFTSGSTGRPRAALHTIGNHFYSALGSNRNIPVEVGHSWLLSLPLYHVGGLAILFRCLLGRAAVRIPRAGAPLHVSLQEVTHASLVATQLQRLLQGAGGLTKNPPGPGRRQESGPENSVRANPLGGLQALLLGGSAIPGSLIRDAYRIGLPIHTSYGSTEMASQVATTAPGASLEELETSGRILPHREVRISGDGEILVRGRTRFAGYVHGSDLEQPFTDDGWFATGDLGRIDAEGRLRVFGRMDNMFISGGENIHPEQIEGVLSNLPNVREAVIVPVRDEEYGRRPVAWVRFGTNRAHFTSEERRMRAAIEAVLPRFMVPIAFYELPSDAPSGEMKVDREALRLRAEELRRT